MRESAGMLEPYRVLDLTDEKGSLCGKILAGLGADVIKVERPGGDPARNLRPFYHDIPDPQKSLHWFAYNAGKRSLTLDIELAEGQRLFKKLLKTADFVTESFPPGYLDGLGLGYSALSEVNPRIILTSITHFGQTGPYRDHKASDLVHMALSGIMSITGDKDRPPVRPGLDQAYNLAGANAGAATMLAHYHRLSSGEGQHVDVSIYECCVRCNYREPVYWEYNRYLSGRAGNYLSRGRLYNRDIWPCQDGYVTWVIFGGVLGARENYSLVEWMYSEGMAGELKDIKWEEVDLMACSQEQTDFWEKAIGRFFLKHTKNELRDGALERSIRLFPIADIPDIVESEQLAARGFWVELEHPGLETTITYPGPFYLSNNTTCKVKRRAPLIGEHNQEIYRKELGVSSRELSALMKTNVI